jgi:hypothetical protein
MRQHGAGGINWQTLHQLSRDDDVPLLLALSAFGFHPSVAFLKVLNVDFRCSGRAAIPRTSSPKGR